MATSAGRAVRGVSASHAHAPGPLLRYGALVVAVVAVSFSAIFIRLASAPPLTIAANRMAIAVVLLLPLLLARRHALAPPARGDLPLLALSGLALAAHFGLWTASLAYTTVASSVVFVSTHPLFVALAGFLWLGEPLTRRMLAGILLVLVGSLALGLEDLQLGGGALYGDALALAGGVVLTGYLLIGRRLRQRQGALAYSTTVYAFCWAALVAAGLLLGQPPTAFAPGDVVWFAALAVVSTLGGHTVFNWSLRHVPATLVSVSFVAEPVGSAGLAWLLLGEPVALLTALGGLLILSGIYLCARDA